MKKISVYIAKEYPANAGRPGGWSPVDEGEVELFRFPEFDRWKQQPAANVKIANLADLIIGTLNQEDEASAILTMSENFVIRLRLRIAQTSAGNVPAGLELKPEQVEFYFLLKSGEWALVLVSEDGQWMKFPSEYREFWSQDYLDVLAMNKAAAKIAARKGGERFFVFVSCLTSPACRGWGGSFLKARMLAGIVFYRVCRKYSLTGAAGVVLTIAAGIVAFWRFLDCE